jgi:uncharacterized membrane protein
MDEIGSSVLALNTLIAAIVVGVPLVLIAILARDARRGARNSASEDDPADDAPATYAEGHVDQLEFERLRSTMQRR